jgi:GNAT superfamily N-acetyltransferase
VAEEWLASKEMAIMRGPINGRVDIGCGFLYEGFDSPPSLLSSYSPHYYIKFAEKYGLRKSRDLFVYYIDLSKPIPAYLKEAAKRCEERGIRLRGFNRLRAGREMKWWVKLMKETFSEHWGYVPVSDKEVRTRFGIRHARWFVDSRLFLVAEAENKPIGFKWSTPDYNQVLKKLNGRLGIIGIIKFLLNKHKIDQGKLNLVGIDKRYRRQGIGSYMNYYTLLEMKRRGYKGAECSWYDEKNIASIRTIEKTGAKLYKKFRVYEKEI